MNININDSASPVELSELLAVFYDTAAEVNSLGEFENRQQLPQPYEGLLDHHKHMTVTVEAFHGEPVEVQVLRCHVADGWYCREILLRTRQSHRIVLYGIVRLHIEMLRPEVWQKIEDQSTPLGKVLIEHDVLREVERCQLWHVTAGPRLADVMQCEIGQTMYGRTALIYTDGEPAIELLEIVPPAP